MARARKRRCSVTGLLLAAILVFCAVSFGFLHSAHAKVLLELGVSRQAPDATAAGNAARTGAGEGAVADPAAVASASARVSVGVSVGASAGAGALVEGARGAAHLAAARLAAARLAKAAAAPTAAAGIAATTAPPKEVASTGAQGAAAAGKWRAQPPPGAGAAARGAAGDDWWLSERPTARPTLARCLDLSWLPPKSGQVPNGGTQYPKLFNIREMMRRWPRDETRPKAPSTVADTICRFDFKDPVQRAAALRYREAELPFITYNVDAVEETVRKWTLPYIARKMRTHSSSVAATTGNWKNHFMYWRYARKKPRGWTPPTKFLDWTFAKWVVKAKAARTADDAIYYYKTSTQNGENWIWDDLKCWKPGHRDYNFFIKKKGGQRGIHCRFGIPGTIAEAHTDAGRNMVAVLKGARRYMMAPPVECKNTYMDPDGLPQARHTSVNWSETEKWDTENKKMAKAMGFEAVVAAGDVLFIPSMWIHHIISLTLSAQCNTRSGRAKYSWGAFHACGYG